MAQAGTQVSQALPACYTRVLGPASKGHGWSQSSVQKGRLDKNLGGYAQKKQKVQVMSVRELLGSTF